MKVLFVDTETTGVDPIKTDPWNIAGIIVIDKKPVEHFNIKARPISDAKDISPEALAIGGVTMEDLAKMPHADDSRIELEMLFAKYIDKRNPSDKFVMAGYNVKFDKDMLYHWWTKTGDKFFHSWFYYHTIDLYPIAQILCAAGVIPNVKGGLKLGAVCNHFGIPIEAHNAMSDIQATYNLWATVFGPFVGAGLAAVNKKLADKKAAESNG